MRLFQYPTPKITKSSATLSPSISKLANRVQASDAVISIESKKALENFLRTAPCVPQKKAWATLWAK